MAKRTAAPVVGIVMGSRSDWESMEPARATLEGLSIPCEMRVVSAHRMPDEMFAYAESAAKRGIAVIIAAAGGAAHLPGMTAAKTPLPVIGVPVQSKALHGIDSLLSIAQMPPGVPVATMAVNGARNAGLLAVRILAVGDPGLTVRMEAFQEEIASEARGQDADVSGGAVDDG